jgi:hypothetical protein
MEEKMSSFQSENKEKVPGELKPDEANTGQAQKFENGQQAPSRNSTQPASQSGLAVPKSQVESTFPAKMGHFARVGLIGLGAVSLIFLAGFLASYFVSARPLQASLALQGEELSQAQLSLGELGSQNVKLSGSLATANNDIAALESDIEALQSDLEMTEMHLLLLHTVNDFNTANLALSNGDISGAKVALLSVPKRIEALLPLIETVDAPLAKNLENRFKMIQDNLETDPQTAQFDLGLLAKSLLNVETLLFAP